MHSLLFSGIPPVGTSSGSTTSWHNHATFRDRWFELAKDSNEISTCVGYVSNEATAELYSLLDNAPRNFTYHLTIGMAKFEGLPKAQLESLLQLQKLLKRKSIGTVNVVQSWPFHGKVNVFTNRRGVTTAILGSSNLSGIVKGNTRYECDIEISDEESTRELYQFSKELREIASRPIDRSIRTFQQQSSALIDHPQVQRVTENELAELRQKAQQSRVSYDMPIHADSKRQKSNLNSFFGKGRENTQGTIVRPRPWYEVELMPGRNWYRENTKFPGAAHDFTVVTDDGYQFLVYNSYDNQFDGPKNFRSQGDLQILGRWIKGRMEADGALTPGEPVTETTLTNYGRNSISFSRISKDVWFMDFGVRST